MTVAVTISSSTGTFQGGTFALGPLIISSLFTSLQVNSLTFSAATFLSTAGPVGAYGVLIEPPTSNLVVLTLKGITGDTGIPISSNLPTLIPFSNPSASNSIGLASGAQITAGVVTLTFF